MSNPLPGAAIIETVTTTINPDGTVNCAAMGVEWADELIVIKPFPSTRTLRNLRATGEAVVNLTDDILLFTEAALGDPHPPTRPAAKVAGAVLADACSWREVTVEAIDADGPRARVAARAPSPRAPAAPPSCRRAPGGAPAPPGSPQWAAGARARR